MYNKEYITEKLDRAIKSLSFLKANLKGAPAWMHCTEDDPVKTETAYALKQLQIITDHMDARDRAEQPKSQVIPIRLGTQDEIDDYFDLTNEPKQVS